MRDSAIVHSTGLEQKGDRGKKRNRVDDDPLALMQWFLPFLLLVAGVQGIRTRTRFTSFDPRIVECKGAVTAHWMHSAVRQQAVRWEEGTELRSRASARALRVEDRMLVLRIRKNLDEGKFAVQLGTEWESDLSMVSDIDFSGIARLLRRDMATVRTRLTCRGVLSRDVLTSVTRDQTDTIEELEALAAMYREFEATQHSGIAEETLIQQAAAPVRGKIAAARRTIATFKKRNQQLLTAIEAPRQDDVDPATGHSPNASDTAAESLQQLKELWERLNPAGKQSLDQRRKLDEESRALRISRAEIERLDVGLRELQREQELRNAQLSQESKEFVARELVNAQLSMANMLCDIAVRILDVNLQRAFVYLEDELNEAIDAVATSSPGQLISYSDTFVRLDRRYDGIRRRVSGGILASDDPALVQLERDVQDFLLVLGITSQTVDAVEWDLSRTQDAVKSNVEKLSSGISFYLRGASILGQDSWYSLGLVSKAASGKTLTELEARIVQRTARDLLTFIPFVIILIIPLSPPGYAGSPSQVNDG